MRVNQFYCVLEVHLLVQLNHCVWVRLHFLYELGCLRRRALEVLLAVCSRVVVVSLYFIRASQVTWRDRPLQSSQALLGALLLICELWCARDRDLVLPVLARADNLLLRSVLLLLVSTCHVHALEVLVDGANIDLRFKLRGLREL